MADQADHAAALEQAERDGVVRRHRRRAGGQPFRDRLPPGFDIRQPGDEAMAAALADEAEGE